MQLFSPVSLGSLDLDNRVVMAPLTRLRAEEHGVPGELVAQHYAQRASAGLLITEGTFTSAGARPTPDSRASRPRSRPRAGVAWPPRCTMKAA